MKTTKLFILPIFALLFLQSCIPDMKEDEEKGQTSKEGNGGVSDELEIVLDGVSQEAVQKGFDSLDGTLSFDSIGAEFGVSLSSSNSDVSTSGQDVTISNLTTTPQSYNIKATSMDGSSQELDFSVEVFRSPLDVLFGKSFSDFDEQFVFQNFIELDFYSNLSGVDYTVIVDDGGAQQKTITGQTDLGTNSITVPLFQGDNAISVTVDADTTETFTASLDVERRTYQDISAGYHHTCAIDNSNRLYCWGEGVYGQLGDSSNNDSNVPVAVVDGGTSFTPRDVKSVSAGNAHTCAIDKNNSLYCWGSNGHGELGDNSKNESYFPVAVVDGGTSFTPGNVKSVSSGYNYTCAIDSNNGLYCWGGAPLGDASNNDSKVPVAVVNGGTSFTPGDVKSVSTGRSHTCAIDNSNSLYCWGGNDKAQLGNGIAGDLQNESNVPVAVVDMGTSFTPNDVKSVSAGDKHTCAVDKNNSLYCWGSCFDGQTGDGFIDQCSDNGFVDPVAVVDGDTSFKPGDVKSVSAGNNHTCAIDNNNSLYCWGDFSEGQLGNAGNGLSYVPSSVVEGGTSFTPNDVKSISAGNKHTCAIDNNNSCYCWGYNEWGQLGDASNSDSNVPVEVSTLP